MVDPLKGRSEKRKRYEYQYVGRSLLSVEEIQENQRYRHRNSSDNNVTRYFQDVLGSTLTTIDGNKKENYTYSVFGSNMEGDFENAYMVGYNGKKRDEVTGFYNYGFRDYSPEMMRFTTEDPIRSGVNWYNYVNNDPVNNIDLLGLEVYVGYDDLADYKINGKPLGNVGEHIVHSTIIITDDDGNAEEYIESYGKPDEEDILRNTRDTENALRDSRFDEEGLTPSDKNGEWQEQFSNGLFKKDPPPGMTTEEYEEAIRNTASRYDNSDPYFPAPILKPGSSNSNSYVGTILRDAFMGL